MNHAAEAAVPMAKPLLQRALDGLIEADLRPDLPWIGISLQSISWPITFSRMQKTAWLGTILRRQPTA